jgi:hypothetical protein
MHRLAGQSAGTRITGIGRQPLTMMVANARTARLPLRAGPVGGRGNDLGVAGDPGLGAVRGRARHRMADRRAGRAGYRGRADDNAVARVAGLLWIAALPPLTGLTGAAYTDPASSGPASARSAGSARLRSPACGGWPGWPCARRAAVPEG